MQKVFYLEPHNYISSELEKLNKFIQNGGSVISVATNFVGGKDTGIHGGFLVTATDGDNKQETEL